MVGVCVSGDAEVISIDAFIKRPNGVIFGVTLVKVSMQCVIYIYIYI